MERVAYAVSILMQIRFLPRIVSSPPTAAAIPICMERLYKMPNNNPPVQASPDQGPGQTMKQVPIVAMAPATPSRYYLRITAHEGQTRTNNNVVVVIKMGLHLHAVWLQAKMISFPCCEQEQTSLNRPT
jgi:hypothetical protein